MTKRQFHLIAAAVAVFYTGMALGQTPNSNPWMNTSLPPAQRAQLLVAAMTLDQKIQQLHGQGTSNIPEFPACGNTFRHVQGIPSLNIPTFRITNGPLGIGQGDCNPIAKATAYPSSIALAAGFDPGVARLYGDMVGSEAVSVGVHVVEGPGMNMLRIPQGGRNFEYLAEDPFLAGTMAAAEIRAMQSHGVIAMAKHFVGNEQELNRQTVNDVIDERTLAEIYLIPFEMSVKDGQVASVMCAYNVVNGLHACEDPTTLTDFLRTRWGFQGYVQSDFGATNSTAAALKAGEDLEMQNPVWFTPDRINSALAAGAISQSDIDNALLRRFTQMFKYRVFDRPATITPIDQSLHGAVARTIGEEGAVLLRNVSNTLPLTCGTQQIALIGSSRFAAAAMVGGGGSSTVAPLYTVTPLAGLQRACPTATVNLYTVDKDSDLATAADAAKRADIAIVEVGDYESEGADRSGVPMTNGASGSGGFPGGPGGGTPTPGVLPDDIVAAVAAAQPRTVVVLKNGDPVTLPWANAVSAILELWYPGQEDGNIVAELLFGYATPGGKSPMTFPMLDSDVPANTALQYPGVNVGGVPTVYYSEGLRIGYRWYDDQGITPRYPFGFGLSYTTFSVSGVKVNPAKLEGTKPIRVTARVRNTGNRTGAEVVQVYLGMPASLEEPPKRLVGFQKVWLNPGEETSVEITIDPKATNHPLSYWDATAHDWAIAPATYTLYVGTSSRDIISTTSHKLGGVK
jgi:beta-glucosidase